MILSLGTHTFLCETSNLQTGSDQAVYSCTVAGWLASYFHEKFMFFIKIISLFGVSLVLKTSLRTSNSPTKGQSKISKILYQYNGA